MSWRSNAVGRAGLVCVLACLATAGHISSAAAVSRVPVGSAAALAADRVVTVLGEAPGPVRVVSRGFGGGSARLATLSPPGLQRASFYVESVAASATRWAVALKVIHVPADDEEPDRERGELIVSGSTAGGPPRTLAACARNEAVGDTDPIDLSVAGDDVAWSSASCLGATAPTSSASSRRSRASRRVSPTSRAPCACSRAR
jgi:hypothetical protein